jgi:hypothetical protein
VIDRLHVVKLTMPTKPKSKALPESAQACAVSLPRTSQPQVPAPGRNRHSDTSV